MSALTMTALITGHGNVETRRDLSVEVRVEVPLSGGAASSRG